VDEPCLERKSREQGFEVRFVAEKLAEPLPWKAAKIIFVNSMSDLFRKEVPDDYVESVVAHSTDWTTPV
jgi:protein gp37